METEGEASSGELTPDATAELNENSDPIGSHMVSVDIAYNIFF
jgi:hypothetical protein